MIDINLEWIITPEERIQIIETTKRISNVFNSLSEAKKLIFKSYALSDDQQGIGTKWYLEMVGVKHCIQLNLCLADLNKLSQLDVKYKLVFKTNFEHACFEGNKIFDAKNNWRLSCPNTFLNSVYTMSLIEDKIHYNFTFICKMQVHLVRGTDNSFYSIQKDYEKLFNDTKYSDFKLMTLTKKFNVHKNILAARSEVFSAMFEHDMKEKQEGFAEIKEYDDEVVQEFLRYLYCGKIENLEKLAKDLLNVAEKYLIFDLKVVCLEEICRNINVENAVELLSFTDKHNVDHLRSSSIDFIVENIKMIDKSNLRTIENAKLSNEILCRTVNVYC